MVAGRSFQPGTMGRQYSTTPVRCLRAQAVWMEVTVIWLLAMGSRFNSLAAQPFRPGLAGQVVSCRVRNGRSCP